MKQTQDKAKVRLLEATAGRKRSTVAGGGGRRAAPHQGAAEGDAGNAEGRGRES